MGKKIFLAIIILFVGASFLRIAPLIYKGYAPTGAHDNLVLARNFALTGEFKIENEKNVILSSSRAGREGIESSLGNRLTVFLEAEIFKIFGFSPNLPFYASVILFALSTVLIFLLVLRIFNDFWLALSAGVFDLF